MDLAVVVAVFPVVFLAELPDKTMFASLVMASRGHPLAVWLGAAAAFSVHVVIAVTIGVAVFAILPTRVVEAIVAAMFAGGAIWMLREPPHDETELVNRELNSHARVASASFAVIFVAEWGDLTQILTANLAAHYRAPFAVATGAVLALWTVAAVAALGGRRVLARLPVTIVRRVAAAVLLVLAGASAWSAITS